MSLKAIVFNAGESTYSEVMIEKKKDGSCLKSLQKLVGGNITIIPHTDGGEAGVVAYGNEEGFDLQLPAGYVSHAVLKHLGFHGQGQLIPGAYCGNIVLVGHNPKTGNEKSLTKKQLAAVAAAYKLEMGEDADPDAGKPIEEEEKKRPATDDAPDTPAPKREKKE